MKKVLSMKGYVVPFWAVKDYKPHTKMLVGISLEVLKPRRLMPFGRKLNFRIREIDWRGKSSINNNRRSLLPRFRIIELVPISIRIREKITNGKSGTRVIARWEDIKPEYLQKHEQIPVIYSFVFVDEDYKPPC